MVKIRVMADELGVSQKTIYNWISVGKLKMVRPGYVDQVEAYEVWLQQKDLRRIYSLSNSDSVLRDKFGRFSSKRDA